MANDALAQKAQNFTNRGRQAMEGRKFDLAVESGNKEEASAAYRFAVKKVDQAVAHGVIHKNAAAHRKSAFTLKFNKMA